MKIEDDDKMPRDINGKYADMVMDAAATISRMNLARLYSHYFNGVCDEILPRLFSMLGLGELKFHSVKPSKPVVSFDQLSELDPIMFDQAYFYLLNLYQLMGDVQYNYYSRKLNRDQKIEHMVATINYGIRFYWPINNPRSASKVVKQVEKWFKPTYAPVSYVGNSGKRVMTNTPVRIAPLYIMLLDKIADDWSSVATGRLQHFAVLSPMTKNEKFSTPHRNSPVRTIGETEGRIFAGYCGREAIAEMIDRSNNPMTQRNMSSNLLTADQPTNIEHVVDRQYIPLGDSKPLQLVSHMLGTAGYGITYEPENV